MSYLILLLFTFPLTYSPSAPAPIQFLLCPPSHGYVETRHAHQKHHYWAVIAWNHRPLVPCVILQPERRPGTATTTSALDRCSLLQPVKGCLRQLSLTLQRGASSSIPFNILWVNNLTLTRHALNRRNFLRTHRRTKLTWSKDAPGTCMNNWNKGARLFSTNLLIFLYPPPPP